MPEQKERLGPLGRGQERCKGPRINGLVSRNVTWPGDGQPNFPLEYRGQMTPAVGLLYFPSLLMYML